MSLSVRLTLVFGAIGFVTVATVSSLAWWLAASESNQSIDNELLQRNEPITTLAERPLGDSAALDAARERGDRPTNTTDEFNANAEVTTVRVVTSDGSVDGEPVGPPTDAAIASLDDTDPHLESVTVDGVPYRIVTIPVTDPRAEVGLDDAAVALQLARDVTNEQTALSNLATRLALLSIAGVAVVVTEIGRAHV